MAWYKTGTVLVGLNNTVVTGTGTKFAANARVGDGFRGPDGYWYEIVNIASETVLSIFPGYKSNTGTSTDWMIAPIQGYNKESADRLRAITDSFPTQIDAKQDKNKNLTGLSIAPSVNNSIPVFDGTGGSMKSIPIATQFDTDETHIAHIGSGGLMSSTPISLTPYFNADQLPFINGRYLFGNGGINLPTKFCYIDNYTVNGNYFRQVARDLLSNRTWERSFNKDEGNIPWVQTTKQGDFGIGGRFTYDGNLDTIFTTAPVGFTSYSLTASTTGLLPPALTTHDGALVTITKNSSTAGTAVYAINGVQFSRGFQNGVWTNAAWLLLINQGNATNVVDSARYGLMDSQTISGWKVSRFLNGFAVASVAWVSYPFTAGEIKKVSFATPITFVNPNLCTIDVQLVAQTSFDHYGAFQKWMESGNIAAVLIRAGTGAQTINIQGVTITGYWK